MRCLYNPYNALGRGFSRQFFQVFLACLYRIDPNSWKLLKKALLFKAILLFFLFGSAQSYAQIIIAADSANNYSAGNPWNNGSNRGFGFGPWTITTGVGGTAGFFLGNPSDAGITDMSNPSFGLWANPVGINNWINADRSFAHPLPVGATLSIQWGVNWDSGPSGGNKGINLSLIHI